MRLSSAWRSLRVRLPAAIVLLLLAALSTFGLFAARAVRTALVRVAESRIRTASDQLGALLVQSTGQQLARLDSLAARPELVAFLRDGSTGALGAAHAVLDSVVDASSAERAVVLLGPDGPRAVAGDSALGLLHGGPDETRDGVSRFEPWADHVAYRLVVPVTDGTRTLGHLIEARAVESNPASSGLIADLIGREADFAIGSSLDGAWTDLAALVDPPPDSTEVDVVSRLERADGEPVLGQLTRVGDRPWLLWVALPESIVLAPMRPFVAGMVTVGLLLVGAAGLVALYLSDRVVGRLGRMTAGAEAIARGDFGQRVGSRSDDEVGRLGRAFDAMADHVERSHHLLEERVRARTEELQAAVDSLREAQEELVRKERLALLGELAGGVGHELRNPLGVMTNAVYVLDAVLERRPDQVDDYLDILRDQIHLSEKIVRDLLDFARVKDPRPEPTDVKVLVESQVARAGDFGGIALERDLPSDLPTVFVDAGQVGQVLLNLVMNARQAVSDNGHPGRVTLRARTEGDRVVVDVEDNGPGVPHDVAPMIFEPLFTTKARGIGLGLSVSRSLLEANGGSLTFVSEPGRGATFTVSLPTRPEAA